MLADTDTDTDTDSDGTTTSDSSTTGPTILESGRLEGWAAGYPIIIGNELQDPRGFLGEFHHVAVYDRALAAEEIETLHDAGEP